MASQLSPLKCQAFVAYRPAFGLLYVPTKSVLTGGSHQKLDSKSFHVVTLRPYALGTEVLERYPEGQVALLPGFKRPAIFIHYRLVNSGGRTLDS